MPIRKRQTLILIPTNRTWLRGRHPTTYFMKNTVAFVGLMLQFIQKTAKRKIRDALAPECLHRSDIQVFKNHHIK